MRPFEAYLGLINKCNGCVRDDKTQACATCAWHAYCLIHQSALEVASSCRCQLKKGVCMPVSAVSSSSVVRVAPPPTPMTVAQAQAALKNNRKLTIAIADTTANIKANFANLAKVAPQIKSIVSTTPEDKLTVTAEQAKNFTDVLIKTPTYALVISDSFDALNGSLTALRKLNDNIKTLIITPTPVGTLQKIDPYDSKLWGKSINGRFEIATNPGVADSSKSLSNNYMAIKALEDRGLLAGIESIKGATITANVDQSQKLAAIFQKYDTEFYLNIKDTSANISKGIEFIAANNGKLTGITQIGDIKPLEITRVQNKLADRALAKMKNAYSLKLYQ